MQLKRKNKMAEIVQSDVNKVVFHLGKRKLTYEYHSEEGHIYLDDLAFDRLMSNFAQLRTLYDEDKIKE